jgi:hypothetical protein
VQRWSIRAITRELKLSRNTVRKAVRSGETSFAYERGVQPRPKLGPWIEELKRLLAENDTQPARERLDLIGIFETLRRFGYPGGYDVVRRYVRAQSRRDGRTVTEACMPLSFAPGEAY